MEVISLASNYRIPFRYSTPVIYEAGGSYQQHWITNAYDSADDTSTAAQLRGTGGTFDILFNNFDVSAIPDTVKITKLYFRMAVLADSSYLSNLQLHICQNDTVLQSLSIGRSSSIKIHTIELSNTEGMTGFDIKGMGLSLQYSVQSGMSSYLKVYGMDMHVEYEESNERTLQTIPTKYMTPFKRKACEVYAEDTMFTKATSNALSVANSDTYGTVGSPLYYDTVDVAFTDFDLSSLPEVYRTTLAYLNFKEAAGSSDNETFRTVFIYSKQDLIYEFPLPNGNADANMYLFQLDNFRNSYLEDFKVVYQITTTRYSTSSEIYGMDLNLVYLEGEEEPVITETVVKVGYSKKEDEVSYGSNIQTNITPNTSGYIGNLYNDDLDDYAEFTYVPNINLPEDIPEEELRTLGIIKIDSPTFTSMGIPNNATISNIKLTKLSEKTCEYDEPICDLYLQINGEKYDRRDFVSTSGFTTNVYDSQDISIHKLDLVDDKVSFMLEWKSHDTPFNLKVKYLLWDITYVVGDRTYSIQFNNSKIDKFSVGQNEVITVYIGATRIYG